MVEKQDISMPKKEISDFDQKTSSLAITSIGKASVSFTAYKVDKDLENEIIQKAKEGFSEEEIAEQLKGKVSLYRVSTIIQYRKDLDRIVELYRQGVTKNDIAKILNASSTKVKTALGKLENIDEIEAEHIKNASRTIINDEIIDKMVELYKKGDTAAQIGLALGCSELTVARNLKTLENWKDIREEHVQNYNKINQQNGKVTIITQEKKDKMVELYAQGLSANKIAKILNCGETTVARYISKQPNKDELEEAHKANSEIKPISKDIEKEIIELYKQGKSSFEIEKLLGIGSYRISNLLRNNENWAEIEAENLSNRKISIITQEKIDKMVELYVQGKSTEEIAEIIKCDQSTVRKHIFSQENKEELIKLHNENIQVRDKKEAIIITPERLDKIIELYKSGKSYKQISEIIGCNQSTVKRKLVKLDNYEELKIENLKNTTKKIVTPKDVEKMVELFRQGENVKNIAKTLGYDATTINKYLEKQPNIEQLRSENSQNSTKVSVTDKDVQRMVDLYKQGKTTKEIAEILGFAKSTVKVHLKKVKNRNKLESEHKENYNLLNRGRIIVTPDLVEKMAILRKEGKSTRRIAIILGCSKNAILDNLTKRDDFLGIEQEHNKNKQKDKENVINDIIKEYELGTGIVELSQKYGFTQSTIKVIIAIKEKNIDYTETEDYQYDSYSLEELHGRIVEFYINNSIENENLENVIDFLDSQDEYITEENKSVLIDLCRDLDKIEQNPNNTDKIIENSKSILVVEKWIEKVKEEDEDFELLLAKNSEMFIQLQMNELFSSIELLENLIPTNKKEKDKIETLTMLVGVINDKLNSDTVTNNDRNYVNNIITFYSYNNKNDKKSLLLLEKAIKIYNKDAEKQINLNNINQETNEVKEKIGQIINISNILDGAPFNERIANEYKYFIDIYRGKDEIKGKAISSLVKLDDYFRQNGDEKYLYKNFEQVAKECFFDQDITKIFLDNIYKYTYKNIGNDNLDLELTDAVLEDNIWKKTLNAKEKSDFIKTLENGVLDLNPRSRGRINLIKGEGKVESGGKKYQLVELKIDSQWRIFGYQDPNNGKRFIFDKLGKDDNGINNYKFNFFKNHTF